MNNRLRKTTILLAVLFFAFMMAPKEVQACTCEKLEGKYNKLQNKYTAAVMAGNAVKANNYKLRIINLVKLLEYPILLMRMNPDAGIPYLNGC